MQENGWQVKGVPDAGRPTRGIGPNRALNPAGRLPIVVAKFATLIHYV
jgi:hypothetical protein